LGYIHPRNPLILNIRDSKLMLRFFRTIRKTLIGQNKTRSYFFYAIGEIALVMIGILLALQVNNWNESRKENIQELEILYDLKNEFIINRTELELAIERKEVGLDNFDSRIKLIIENDDKALFEQRFDGGGNTFNPSEGVKATIISTGQINLLQNDSLKFILANWGSKVKDIQQDELGHLDFMINVLDEYENRAAYKFVGNGELVNNDYLIWVDEHETELRARIRAALISPIYLSYYVQGRSMLKMTHLEFISFEKEYSDVEAMIDAEIKKKE